LHLYYFSIFLVVASNIFYHLSQKSTPSGVNPIHSLIVTYATAIVCSLLILPFYPSKESFLVSLGKLNWASIVLGISIVGLELGFLLAYRAGWNIGLAQFFATVLITLLLIPIGMFFFQEKITMVNIIGILLCLGGFILINHK